MEENGSTYEDNLAFIEAKKDSSNDRKKKVAKSFHIDIDGRMYEQVWSAARGPMFMVMNDNNPKLVEEVEGFVPIGDSALTKGVVLLPDTIEEYGDVDDLVGMLQNHIHKYLDISEDHEIFCCYYILLSWLFDKTTTLNYMRALGDWGSGKSRYLDVIGRLCYKPILVFGALTPAVLYRMLDLWGGTLVVDEADFKKSDEQADIMKILNAGFEKSRGAVARCNPNDPTIIDTFCVYGPKVIASRKTWFDKALESRCLTERMMQTSRKDIIPVLDDEYYDRERKLRRMLLKFRFDYYNKIRYEYHDLGIPELEPRLKQSISSFTVLMHNIPSLMKRFKEFIKKYNGVLIEERAESTEGIIVQSVVFLLSLGEKHINSKDVSMTAKEEFGRELTPAYIGRILKSMGFDNKPTKIEGKTKRVLFINPKSFKTVIDRYLPVDHEYRQAVTANGEKVTEVTEVTDTLGDLAKFVITPSDSEKASADGGTPVTTVTGVTNVTDKLGNWRKSGDSGKDLTPQFLENTYELSETELEKAKREGLVFSPHPGRFQLV